MPPETASSASAHKNGAADDWQAVADELAGALRTTMLRNPTLLPRDWDRAHAALERYDGATRGVAVEFPSS